MFAAIFIGMAFGMAFGTRPFGDFSRRRLFGLSLTASAVPLALIGLVPNLIFVVFMVILIGIFAGIAYPRASRSSGSRSTTRRAAGCSRSSSRRSK